MLPNQEASLLMNGHNVESSLVPYHPITGSNFQHLYSLVSTDNYFYDVPCFLLSAGGDLPASLKQALINSIKFNVPSRSTGSFFQRLSTSDDVILRLCLENSKISYAKVLILTERCLYTFQYYTTKVPVKEFSKCFSC